MSTRKMRVTASSEWWKAFEIGIKRCGEVYRLELGEEALAAYAEALAPLSPDVLAEAFRLAISRIAFMPKPAQILESSREVIERMPRRRTEAKDDCKLCGGTGFKLVPRPDGRGQWAAPCDCRKGFAKEQICAAGRIMSPP